MGWLPKVVFAVLAVFALIGFTEARCNRPTTQCATRFCTGLFSYGDVFSDCGTYYYKNGRDSIIDWCKDLYLRYGRGAKCQIIGAYVDKCRSHGFFIEDDIWRKQLRCPRPGVLITTPNLWTDGQYGEVCVDFHNLHFPASVHVSIMEKDDEVFSHTENMECSGCLKVPIPEECITKKYTLIVSICSAFYQYTSEKTPIFISCSKRRRITFIQTDKPIYKAGQIVRFRVLSVSLPKLTPIVEKIDCVYMKTPDGTKVLQQNNVSTTLGLAELEFQLDKYPPLGMWSIFVENSAGMQKKQFKVDEFVLPKWDVTIETPSTVDESGLFNISLCAKYTYGKAVQGNYTVEVATIYWPKPEIDSKSFTGQISSGCVTINVDVSELEGFDAWAVKASVTENATGKTRSSTNKIIWIISNRYRIRFNSQTPYYFKQDCPIPVQISLMIGPNPSPGKDVKIELFSGYRREYPVYSTMDCTDKDGKLSLLIPTLGLPTNATVATIQVSSESTHARRYLRAWYSESKLFVTILPPFETVPCNCNHTFRILHNAPPGTQLHYMLISKRFVIKTGMTCMYRRFSSSFVGGTNCFDLNLTISPLLSGEATMLVYYVTDCLEFIADFLKFDVEECFNNEVAFKFDRDEGEPGDEVMYTLTSASDSLCSIEVIDKGLEILAGNSFILKSQVFKFLRRFTLPYTSSQFRDQEYCREQLQDKVTDSQRLSATLRYWSDYVDSSLALKKIGVYAVSDLVLQTRPCESGRYQYYTRSADGSFSINAVRSPSTSISKSLSNDESKENEESVDEGVEIRKLFPETFLWKLVVIPKSGQITESAILPDTITEWYGNALCINKDVGMGISDFASITTFKTFFLYLNLPYSIIRGETVHIPVILFNYLPNDQCMAVNIEMEKQPAFKIEGSTEYTVCSWGQQSLSVDFIITSTVIGEIDLQVVAKTVESSSVCKKPTSSISASDGVLRKLIVKPEGIEESYNFGHFLCAPASISTELPLPEDYVHGSERGQVSAVGDIMGPALSNLDGLIRRPCGCGEQTIYLTGQAAIVLKYLDTKGEATAAIKSKAIASMSYGYQRELTFKHPNGAYSAFGTRDPEGSNWLTAYVLKVFALSQEYIFIDPHEQEISMQFIKSGQSDDGCFPQVGRIIHKNMMGGLITGDKPIALTAFILTSLLEAGESTYSKSVTSAIGCLNGTNPADMSTYALALSAYAYTLYGQNPTRRQAIMDELEKRAIVEEDGNKYWSDSEDSHSSDSKYWWLREPPSYDVEMTAYVLLAIAKAGGDEVIAGGIPIVKWLTSQRNAYGGWSSTQDTFVGLLALSKYSLLFREDVLNLDVNISPPDVKFHIDERNSGLLQSSPVDVPNNISITLTGSGCAIVQASVWYNVIPLFPEKPYFDIELNVVPGSSCKRQSLDICVSYARSDGPTNMALVQVKMVSGWEVDKDTLPELSEEITKIEIDKDMVTFYFNELNSTKTCFTFQVTREVDVENAKPGYLTVFDYYDSQKTSSVQYKLKCH